MIFSFTRLANSNAIVDFHIHGSHDNSTTQPGTIQPHRTLFNSIDLVLILISLFSDITSSSFDNSFTIHLLVQLFQFIFASLNSFNVFHCLQKVH
ncbi:MAG: hypothetical protein U9Q66_00690 [Patescibacteria group bacterium]|nr:hypothetical protein [Patescibacteria group bacterium]